MFSKAIRPLYGCVNFFDDITVTTLKKLAGGTKIICRMRRVDQMIVHIPRAVVVKGIEYMQLVNSSMSNCIMLEI